MATEYHLTILQGYGGQAHAINELGQVVGGTVVGSNSSGTGSWWFPIETESGPGYSAPSTLSSYGIDNPYLLEIDVYGNVIPGTTLFNIHQGMSIFSLLPASAMETAYAMNNKQQITSVHTDWPPVSGNAGLMPKIVGRIYTYSFSNVSYVSIPPLDDQPSIGLGINDLGDVVGRSYNSGFYYPNGGPINDPTDGTMTSGLYAINNEKLAVGYIDSVKVPTTSPNYISPAWIDYKAQLPTLQAIKLPYPTGSAGLVDACATAVNNSGTIVGWSSGLLDAPTTFAFVYQAGESEAVDLNKCVNNLDGWLIQYAWDINDKGQIVGLARKGNAMAAYVLTPLPKIRIPRGM